MPRIKEKIFKSSIMFTIRRQNDKLGNIGRDGGMVYTQDLKSCDSNVMWVRLPLAAQIFSEAKNLHKF